MTRDTARDNIDSYLGTQARKAWSVETELFSVEREIIARHFPAPPAKVLDLGCGAGRTTVGLEALGFDVEALDVSADLVEEARQRVQRTTVHVMDARELAFPAASFDAAMFSFNGLDCVHPSSERRRVLAEVFRVLRPGGVFYYSGHNGVAAWTPRPGDSLGRFARRTKNMLLAQRRSFGERGRYLAYPDVTGSQVLYSVLPHTHLAEQRALGFAPIAAYASRSYRTGPHYLDEPRVAAASIVTCPHLHYVAKKPA